MKTHDIAKILINLGHALQRAPNQSLDELTSGPRRSVDPSNVPMALSTLVALSDIDKSQWLNLIRENNFPIEVRPRDASRDILGKLLRYLEQNSEARKKLSNVARSTRTETSPELMKALQFLLKDT